MNQLESLRVFCIAAEAVNFRDAATRLGVSPQVVTRSVRELEDALGEPLFHRSTRGVRLSTFGEQLAQRARDAVGGIDQLFHRVDRRALSELAGVVRIAAPSSIGRHFILQALSPVLRQHPEIVIDLRLSEARADVVDQQIDVGVRIGFMRDSRFVARRVSTVNFAVVGTPERVASSGIPASLDALFDMPVTALIDRNSGRPWPWVFRAGKQRIPPAPAFVTDDPDTECAAVLDGLAYGQIPDYLAAPYLQSGKLVEVLSDEAPEPWGLYVYRAQRTPVPARVRLIYDRLVDAMSADAGLLPSFAPLTPTPMQARKTRSGSARPARQAPPDAPSSPS
jgi:DNA-binding transcriptional LysR family regulator